MDRKTKRQHRLIGSIGLKAVGIVICSVMVIQPIFTNMPLLQSAFGPKYVSAATNGLSLKGEQIISSGVIRKEYTYSTTRKSKTVKTDVHVMEIDLSNPYISLQAMSGEQGTVGQRRTVLHMTKQTGAIAAVNGDVFAMKNEGAPLGTQIMESNLVVSPSLLQGMYAFGIDKNKKPIIDSYVFEGKVTASNGNSFALSGINKSTYSSDVTGAAYSHLNSLFIYTSAWGGSQRPVNSSTTPTEVLVIDHVVTDIPESGIVSTPIPSNGYVLRAHGTAATYLKQNFQIGDRINTDYSLISQTTKQKIDPSSFEMMVSGHTLLVENGQASSFSRDITGVSGSSYTSRTAIGYSKDGKKVYMVTSEKSGSNTGLSLKELQQVMVGLGAYKAVNLDGGGSTTMTERSLGTTNIVLSHPTQESSLRSVANGIGVFTNAPQGSLKGMFVNGADLMFVGQSTKFSVNGYDTYYNPIIPSNVTYSSSSGLGSFSDQSFTATKSGTAKITAASGQITASKTIEIVSGKDLKSLIATSTNQSLTKGAIIPVKVTAALNNGGTYQIDGKYINWEFIGFKGSFKDGAIVVESVSNDATMGYAVGRYDGVATMIAFSLQEKSALLEDFETSRYAITSQVLPAGETQGAVKIVGDLPNAKGKSLQISYDFTSGTGTKASYAALNSNGISLANGVRSLTMDVYGDNSNNWMRVELVDAKGNLHYGDIAKNIDWSGWKNVKVELNAPGMVEPLKLRRIYVITLDSSQIDKAVSGVVAVDNIKQNYAGTTTGTTIVPTRLELVINNSKAVVNGKQVALDSPPTLKNNSTYVPLRFISENMGAQLKYDNVTKTVTVINGTKLLEMKVGTTAFYANGVRGNAEVAPFIANGRTLVPIRLISEQLGYEVLYNNDEKRITIQ